MVVFITYIEVFQNELRFKPQTLGHSPVTGHEL